MAAHTMISEYLTPRISAMMKAAAPIMGGSSWPPTDAAADTAPANSAEYPVFFIRGMVKDPVVTTLATADPLMEPRSPAATTDTLAGPPLVWPARDREMSLKNFPMPDLVMTQPKRMNRKI